MSGYDKEVVENLKLELSRIEEDVKRVQAELETLQGRRKAILEQLAEHSDERYEEDMLTRVYNQRRRQG